MNCEKIKVLLLDFAEMKPEKEFPHKAAAILITPIVRIRERLIQQHLKKCDRCREELEQIEQVRQELREIRAPELTDIAWQNFQEKLSSRLAHIEQLPQPRHFPKSRLVFAGVGAVFAIFLLLVLARQLMVEPMKKNAVLAKKQVPSITLPEEQGIPENNSGMKETSELSLAGLSSEEVDQFVNDVALLSDEEWDEFMDSMNDSMIASWDVEDEVDALSLEECDEMLERLEST